MRINTGHRREVIYASRGFTLIEVMMVIAILGILTAVALPSYTQYVMRGRLVEATSALAGQRVKMEQFYQDNRTYTGTCVAGTVAPPIPNTANFTFACTIALDGQSYDIDATGAVGSSMAGFTLRVDQSNTRSTVAVPAGWQLPGANCWVQKKNGEC